MRLAIPSSISATKSTAVAQGHPGQPPIAKVALDTLASMEAGQLPTKDTHTPKRELANRFAKKDSRPPWKKDGPVKTLPGDRLLVDCASADRDGTESHAVAIVGIDRTVRAAEVAERSS